MKMGSCKEKVPRDLDMSVMEQSCYHHKHVMYVIYFCIIKLLIRAPLFSYIHAWGSKTCSVNGHYSQHIKPA